MLPTLIFVCCVSLSCLLLMGITMDIENQFVTICAPMGFLVAVIFACEILCERQKSPSERKPLTRIGKLVNYIALITSLTIVCLSLAPGWSCR